MSTKSLSVYQALVQLSRYKDQLNKLSTDYTYVYYAPKTSKQIHGTERSKFENTLKSNYDSTNSLINNIQALETAIAVSNATTIVKINDVSYTVAAAIKEKEMSSKKLEFYNSILENISQTNAYIEKTNINVELQLPDYLNKVKSESSTADEIELLTKKYYDDRKLELVDPLKLSENINKKKEDIYDFLSIVDTVLTESNVSTIITVEFLD